MDILFVILIIICAVALMAVVLIQNAKGGGLASNVGISTQMLGGVKKATDGIEKLTWGLMISLFVLCVVSGFVFGNPQASAQKKGPKVTELPVRPTDPSTMPVAPTPPVETAPAQ